MLSSHTHSLVLFVHIAGLGQLDVSCAQLAWGGELDSILGAGDHDGVADLWKVTADASELPGGHLHHTAVLLLLEGQADMERLATVWGKPCRTQIEDVTADLPEYQAAPHPGPSVSSHNLTPSPGLQDWREAVNTPPWHHQSDWCYWINIEFKLTESLKDEGERVCIVFCSEGDDVLISGTLQDFWHTG